MTKPISPLTVYRASAGSGKTFTLAIRYIELLIDNPLAYQHTLAVTFTNKATEEMKMRILSQLYGLHKDLDDSKNYMERIQEDLGCTKQHIIQQTGIALNMILHDYSNFHVETIDSFFQRILRNLAHELELNANLKVELGAKEVKDMAVEKLIAELKENDDVLRWIMEFIDQMMEEDTSWNVISKIKEFGEKIFSKQYRENADELKQVFSDDKFFTGFRGKLQKIVNDADSIMVEYADRFFKALEDNGYNIDDFSRGKSGACGYFIKLKRKEYDESIYNSYAAKASVDASGWVNKANMSKPIAAFAEGTLVRLICDAEKERCVIAKKAKTARLFINHINQLRLLNKIEEAVAEVNAENHTFLLDNTQYLLNDLMKDTDTPFVFEKIGGRIRNIMIDEFQDTSTIQWANFKKMLAECMSTKGSQNLIVGDVKQSIYRWRNGDWSLLNNIGDDEELKDKGIYLTELDTNHRSCPNIIIFNNEFFLQSAVEEAKNLTEEMESLKLKSTSDTNIIKEIYSKKLLEQKYPKDKEKDGYVEVTMLPHADYKEGCMEKTKTIIEMLAKDGVKDNNIAILARGNKEIATLATWLQDQMPDHTFISDEAYCIDASMAVNIIVDALKVLMKPKDTLLRAQLAKRYQQHIHKNDVSTIFFKSVNSINEFLPVEFVTKRSSLIALPIADLVEKIYNLFSLKELGAEAAYINAFIDKVNSFSQTHHPDLNLFLELWSTTLHSQTVQGGDLSGIRLLTIHKSKGLEFDHVIIPYCNWDLDKGSTLWCKTTEEPFSEIPVMPLNSTSLKDTIYGAEYFEEHLQAYIDNLNMLYVAFTRAGKSLFVIGKNNGAKVNMKQRSGLIQKVLSTLVENKTGCLDGDFKSADKTVVYSYGTMPNTKDEDKEKSSNVFLVDSDKAKVLLEDTNDKLEFRQSNRSRSFVSGEEKMPENQKYITQGTVLHSVLSLIHNADEVERVLDDFMQEGIVADNDENLNRKTLSSLLRKRIKENPQPIINRWFANDVEVFNECTILCYDKHGEMKELRPDRVVKDGNRITVIDFKFGAHNENYKDQVRTYMGKLADMGYTEVDGYLWYVYKNEIDPVKM